MTDHDFGDDQDPLLVRPFVLNDAEAPGDDPSTQTWPSATTREVRSRHASAAEPPTQVIPRTAPRRRYRRRLLVVGGVGAAVLLAAAAAALAALRPEVNPSVAAGADGSLPVVTGPASPVAGAPTAASASPPAATHGSRHPASARPGATVPASSGTRSASPTAGRSPSGAVPSSAGTGFGPHNVAPATDRTGTVRGQNGLCLDLTGALPFDGNYVQVFTCNTTAAQVWTLATDGTLRVMGKCALVAGGNAVQIVTCDGRTTARWQVSGSQLVSAANGQCLTDPSGGRVSGTPVVVSPCGGSADQAWSLP